jgi:hypothetical protein
MPAMSEQHRNNDPDAPPRLGQSYIPQRYPWQIQPLSRFFWGLILRPRRENWLLVGLLFGSIALFLALIFAVGIVQTEGLSWWSLGAVAAVAALLALEYLLFRLRRQAEPRRLATKDRG